MKRGISLLALVLTDIIALIFSFYLAYFLRVNIIQELFHIRNPWFFPIEHFYRMYYLLFVFILIFSYEKLYTYNRRYDFFEEFVFIARGLFISVVLIAVVVYLSRAYENYSRAIPLIMMLLGMVIVPLARYLVKRLLIRLGLYCRHAAVLGLKEETESVLPILKKLEASGWRFDHVVFITDNTEPAQTINKTTATIETLIIVSNGIPPQQLNSLINHWENAVKEIKIISDPGFLKTIGVETEYIEELFVIRMANNLLSPMNRLFKRLFDLVLSIIALIFAIPIFLIIALFIKLNSRGPVLFVQERFGKAGKKFKLLKFRSMFIDGDEKLQAYLQQHPELQEEWTRYKKLKSADPRVTAVGKFLRRFSLDEAPQLFNVLKGDMSLVGPRPYLPREKEDIQQHAAIIFRVKSGLTGLWQIKGRNDLSFQVRMRLDEFYVRNWSLLLDITIILKTFGTVLKGKGAY